MQGGGSTFSWASSGWTAVHSHPDAGHGWGTPEGTHRLCCFAGTSKSGRLHMCKHTAIKANSSGGGQRTQIVPAFPLITGCGQTICCTWDAPAPQHLRGGGGRQPVPTTAPPLDGGQRLKACLLPYHPKRHGFSIAGVLRETWMWDRDPGWAAGDSHRAWGHGCRVGCCQGQSPCPPLKSRAGRFEVAKCLFLLF